MTSNFGYLKGFSVTGAQYLGDRIDIDSGSTGGPEYSNVEQMDFFFVKCLLRQNINSNATALEVNSGSLTSANIWLVKTVNGQVTSSPGIDSTCTDMYFEASHNDDATLTAEVQAAVQFDEEAGEFNVSVNSSTAYGVTWPIKIEAFFCDPQRASTDTSICPVANRTFLDDTIVYFKTPELDCSTHPVVISDNALDDLASVEFSQGEGNVVSIPAGY